MSTPTKKSKFEHRLKKIKQCCLHPKLGLVFFLCWLFGKLRIRKCADFIPDKVVLEMNFYIKKEKLLCLKNPKTFNEKMQWIKLYDRKPRYTQMVDKYAVRQYVSEKIGGQYLIPLLGGPWERFDEIDFSALPDQFVLKCTHDSGGNIICKNREAFDPGAAREKMELCLARNWYRNEGREWVYKDVPPRLIAEKYMVDESEVELKDYKIFCFNGVAKTIQVDVGRFTGHKRNFYNAQWEIQPMALCGYAQADSSIPRPQPLERMLNLAQELAKETLFLRVDFYVIGENIYFGELTFYPEGGLGAFAPEKWDEIFGSWIQLPLDKPKAA